MKNNKIKKKMLKQKIRIIESDFSLPIIKSIEELTDLTIEDQLETLCNLVMELNNKYNEQKEINKQLLTDQLEVYNLLELLIK